MVNGFPMLPACRDSDSRSDLGFRYLQINSLRDLSRVNPDLVTRHIPPLSDADDARWGLLNTALFSDGLYLKISGKLAAPLVIVHAATADRAGTIAYPRIIVEAAPGSNATIIELHVQRGEWTPLCNSVTRLTLARDALIEHHRIFATGSACTHIDSLDVRQQRGSRCRQFTMALGGGLVRASLDAHLSEPGASLDSYSLLVGHEERHVDCVNVATHSATNTRSQQTARSIASGTSRVIFNSKVVVEAGASQAVSQQSCRGLLLSDSAEIDSRPQLEIHADEVKCAHGATTGRLDPDMLFYMLSRGLDRATAQSLLIYAFLADVLTGMSLELGPLRHRRRADRSIAGFASAAGISVEQHGRPRSEPRLRCAGRSQRISDSATAWCTASRSPTSTTAPRLSVRMRSSARWTTTNAITMPTYIAACIP